MIAISARGENPTDQVDSRFGRCEYIVFHDLDTGEFSARENSSRIAAGGAGVNAAELLAENNVDVLLTGNIGPKALQILKVAGIEVYTGATGTVEEAVEAYRRGELEAAEEASVRSHFGQGRRRGR